MARIELRNVQKYFGDVQVLHDINLVIEDGSPAAARPRPCAPSRGWRR